MFGLDILSKLTDFMDKEEMPEGILLEEQDRMKKEEVANIEDYLSVNTRISISIKHAVYNGVYDSRVEDIEGKTILIAQPSDDGIPVPMVPGTRAIVEFVSNFGRFRFESEVTGRRTQGKVNLIEIIMPKTLSRSQLREFYRVSTRIKAKLKIFFSAVPDKNMKIPHKSIECLVVDISGGGGKLVTPAWIEKGQQFMLDVSEAVEGMENAPCEAVRVKRIMEKTEVSFRFQFDKETDRNQVVKYVFKRQIELKEIFG